MIIIPYFMVDPFCLTTLCNKEQSVWLYHTQNDCGRMLDCVHLYRPILNVFLSFFFPLTGILRYQVDFQLMEPMINDFDDFDLDDY